ncbi:MAG: DNA polymerase I [Moorellales bacterium]
MKGKLLLLDGNSLLHRAFHALPPLSTKQGLPTNAAYGFTTMLFKALEQEKPTHVAVAFDKARVTFRHEQYRDYKAQRPPTPEELRPQFEWVKRILSALNIPYFELEGYEADDLIGTLVRKAEEQGLESVIVTADRDALQLVSDRTRVLLTKRGISQLATYDHRSLQEELGLEPRQIVDLKALMGDPSDNIPGVPGVGEKTALKLVREYGSLEELLSRVSEVYPPSLAEKLVDHAQQARLSKQLATIYREVPLEIDWESCRHRPPNREELLAVFRELEFKSLLKSVLGVEPEPSPARAGSSPRPWKELRSAEELKAYLEGIRIRGRGALALIWEGRDYFRQPLRALGLAAPDTVPAGYDPGRGDPRPALTRFISEGTPVLAHDAKATMVSLARMGLPLWWPADDTLLMAYLREPGAANYALEELAARELKRSLEAVSPVEAAALRAEAVLDLAAALQSQMRLLDLEKLYREVELPLTRVLAEMELCGIRVDVACLEELGKELAAGMEKVAQEIYRLAGEVFNLNSPRQLGQILFEKLGLPKGRKTKTGYSTSAEVLEELAAQHPIAAKILEYRQLMKLKSTYVDGLKPLIEPDTGKIHTTFHQAITATGRLSSAEPNLQNIPVRLELGRRLRRAFGPSAPDRVILAADYSQIELRVLAHISGDEGLIAAFHQGQDIHTRTACEVFGVSPEEVTPEMRRRAKAVNFGIVYGISDFGLARDLGISRQEAREYIDRYFRRYPGVKKYVEEIVTRARENGYVTTLLNRRRYLPDLFSRDPAVRSFGERTAMNTPIQGSAADIIKVAMVLIYRALKEKGLASQMILQVHDELIFDTPKEELASTAELVRQLMEGAFTLRVPLVVELKYGPNWYELKPWEKG